MNATVPGSPERVPFFRRLLTICRKSTFSLGVLGLVAACAAAGRAGSSDSAPAAMALETVTVEYGEAVTLVRRAPQPN
jgi:hypothetical protein